LRSQNVGYSTLAARVKWVISRGADDPSLETVCRRGRRDGHRDAGQPVTSFPTAKTITNDPGRNMTWGPLTNGHDGQVSVIDDARTVLISAGWGQLRYDPAGTETSITNGAQRRPDCLVKSIQTARLSAKF